MSVVLGFCDIGIVYTPFMSSVLNAFTVNEELGTELIGYTSYRSPYIPEARCEVVRKFLEATDADWLWFCDTDIEFPPDALARLLNAADPDRVPILGAAYWNEFSDGCYLTWLICDDDGFHPIAELPDVAGPVEVSSVGMGCTLIHRSVLETMERECVADPCWPWFGTDLLQFSGGITHIGDDPTFCARAKLAGFPIHGLPSLVVEHFKPHRMRHGDPVVPVG
jgi:hypothetical protein